MQEKAEVFSTQVQSLQTVRQGTGFPAGFRPLQDMLPPDGAAGRDSRRDQGELVGARQAVPVQNGEEYRAKDYSPVQNDQGVYNQC